MVAPLSSILRRPDINIAGTIIEKINIIDQVIIIPAGDDISSPIGPTNEKIMKSGIIIGIIKNINV